jgi:hypothetical protein
MNNIANNKIVKPCGIKGNPFLFYEMYFCYFEEVATPIINYKNGMGVGKITTTFFMRT